jgi:hypothetical protein
MTVHVIYLKLEGYVRMWLVHHYGKKGQDPISFPKWSMENDVMQDNLQRKPKDWEPERKHGCIAIKVPKREGLNRDVWCYLPERILVILRKTIMRHFVKDFMKFIATPNPATPTYKQRIEDFMKKNGIEDNKSNMETLLQIRVRKRHLFEAPPDIDSKANKAHKGCSYGRKKLPKKRK